MRSLLTVFLSLTTLVLTQPTGQAKTRTKTPAAKCLTEFSNELYSVIYDKDLQDLRSSKGFKPAAKSLDLYRNSPILTYSDRPRTYRRTEWTYQLPSSKKSQLCFTVYATFQDEDDGGNTLGWIENNSRQVIATIADSYVKAYESPSKLFPSFLQDRQLPELRDDPDFLFAVESVVIQLGALPYLQSEERHYQVIRLTHIPSQTVVFLYATFRDEDDGGNTLGWVQDQQAQLIASIGDSFFNPIP